MKHTLNLLVLFSLVCVSLPVVSSAETDNHAKDVVAVFRFEPASLENAALDSFTEALVKAFVDTKKFTVVEREKLNLILNEMKLQLSGVTSDKDIVSVGKMLNAHYIAVGKIAGMPTSNYYPHDNYRVSVRLIDVEKGIVVALSSVDTLSLPAYSYSVMKLIVSQLIYKSRYFGEGKIVNVTGNDVFVDLHEGDLKEGYVLNITRSGKEIKNKQGELVYQDESIIGKLKAVSIQPKGSRCIILESSNTTVAEGDKVILSIKEYDKGFGAAWRSMLIPGWGQLYNEQPDKGYIHLGVCAMGVLFFFVTQDGYNHGDPGPGITADTKWYCLGAAGISYLWSIIDAIVVGSELHFYEPETACTNPTMPAGLSLMTKPNQELVIAYSLKF